ncbi:MAG: serine/threonine protein kinase [Polyangiaceae bacterium]|nr:serine/threonine protein kinase [Polyangiaceae bacterium]
MSLEIGQLIDNKYKIIRMIGEGGMGAVYEGENQLISRRVAIKVLHASAMASGNDVVERFEREAQAAGRIGSDHILDILDLGTLPSGDRYMVMEFLDGEALSERIEKRGHLTSEETGNLVRQALVGLGAAHDAGIIHRDLKPDNIFILEEKAGRPDYVKLIDFGISKFNSLTGDMRMTSTGAVMGTPYYMAPEQAKGAGGVTPLSDIYSIGVIAFECLTGRVPFEGTSFNDLMFKIVLSELPDLKELAPHVDSEFARIVNRALERNPEDRYQSAEEMASAIDEWKKGSLTLPHGAAGLGTTAAAFADPSDISVQRPPSSGGAHQGKAGFAATAVGPSSIDHRGTNTPPNGTKSQLSTDISWENADGAGVPAKSVTKVWIGLGAGVAAVLAAGAFLTFSSTQDETEKAAVQATGGVAEATDKTDAEERAAATKKAQELQAQLEQAAADRKAAEQAAKKAAEDRRAAEDAARATKEAEEKRVAEKAKEEEARQARAQAAARQRRTQPKKVAPAPAKKKTAPPKSQPAERDFGY